MPFVTIGHTTHPHGTSRVDLDHATLVARCVHHLADLGHRHVALVNRSTELVAAGYGPARRALAGFTEAIAQRWLTGTDVCCDDTAAGGEASLERLRDERPAVTAIATTFQPPLTAAP